MSPPSSIRVENLPTVEVSRYAGAGSSPLPPGLTPFRILLVKPFQAARNTHYGPPLGLLMLASGLRRRFGEHVTIDFWDMHLHNAAPERIIERMAEFRPDLIAVSALNCEAVASYALAAAAKAFDPGVLMLIGGPYTLRQSAMILAESRFDWSFEGASDRTLLQALERHFSGQALGNDIPGFNYRDGNGTTVLNQRQDLLTDLDELPLPAWDLHDFERYRKRDRKRIMTNVDERRYAYLFTSRGCPYLCNYCHDIFTKRFVYHSVERVLEEIRLLHEEYGVCEFMFVDDIFNLHRPRVQAIMKGIRERWPGKLYLGFPNGLRGDILDEETIRCMVEAGTYNVTIAIETVTQRLQSMTEKHLDVAKAMWAIEEFARYGVAVNGSFMLGFPTETPEEIHRTLDYAIRSPLTHANLFAVIPQPQTPIHEQALRESPEATLDLTLDEREKGDYQTMTPWYSRAYGYDLKRTLATGYLRFYLHPPRLLRLLRRYPMVNLVHGGVFVLQELSGSAKQNLKRAWDKLKGKAVAVPPAG